MSKPITTKEFFEIFDSDDVCLDHLMRQRYGEKTECPKCGKTGKFHRLSRTPAYCCQWCGHPIHPMVGTPFERTRGSLQNWFYVMHKFTTTRHGVSAKEMERELGVTYKTAWRMCHEIRKYMASLDGKPPLDGEVEVDETNVGGRRSGGKRGRGAPGKTIVVGMQDRDGALKAGVIPNVKRKTRHGEIVEAVTPGSTIHTDELSSYEGIEAFGYVHVRVQHSAGEYPRDGSHVNHVEGFFGMIKRSIRSTHIWVSRKHLSKYLGEFAWRWNRRHDPRAMFLELMRFPSAP